jgi:hypothetical protein
MQASPPTQDDVAKQKQEEKNEGSVTLLSGSSPGDGGDAELTQSQLSSVMHYKDDASVATETSLSDDLDSFIQVEGRREGGREGEREEKREGGRERKTEREQERERARERDKERERKREKESLRARVRARV